MTAALRGAVGHIAGRFAEEAVVRHYQQAGSSILAERWRGRAGELDIVARDGAEVVFIEVKRSRSFARAAERVTERQIRRIFGAASEFLGGEAEGQNTPVRFDVALVNGIGEIEVLENAFGH